MRRIDSDVVSVRFTIAKALAVRMAARIASVYLENSCVVDSGPKLNTIEDETFAVKFAAKLDGI